MNSFLIAKKGRKLDRKTARGSVSTMLCENKRPVGSLAVGTEGGGLGSMLP